MAMLPIAGVGPGVDALSLYRSMAGVGAPTGTQPAGPASTAGTTPQSFSAMIADKIGGVVDLQNQGAVAGQALATGTATDVSAATITVEKAAISLQLAAAFRNKAVEAYQDVMRMQI
jgi:flagellar hook-basal body complex protein FliE